MSVSLEALAMAGIDSNEWAMDAQEWERNETEIDVVPPHLLANEDDNDDDDDENVMSIMSNYRFPMAGFFGSRGRKDGRGDGVHCILGIFCSLSKAIERKASNGMNSVRIMVRTILGFLMVMTIKIISAQRSKL
ncbi:unnamed protein product [Citrullus colocynthis]|uniref:Uncharacterized protein n=1 Tax=Citrullus colocynthis TaxID=252529 RepID=A0ABP0Z2B6_9ROSI